MGDGGDQSRGGRQNASIDAVLREVLRQGRLDPGAERLAAQGVERLRTFLTGDASVNAPTGGAAGGDGAAVDAEVVEDVPADAAVVDPAAGAGLLRHTIPLRDGGRAEVAVPEGLTRADARRIAAVLDALALDDEEVPGA
ncbi:hypothetical protein [Kineococcus arenarius]|uniref:hypothetical protein n=1 Tax=Kineococcus sp. SYSU DK007 TaxID=3383128 RepID=UPI003D7EC412